MIAHYRLQPSVEAIKVIQDSFLNHPKFSPGQLTDEEKNVRAIKVDDQTARVFKSRNDIQNHKWLLISDYLPVNVQHQFGDAISTEAIVHYSTQDKKPMFFTSNVFCNELKEQFDPYIFTCSPSIYSEYYKDYDLLIADQIPTKDFCCFINRMDPSRQGWFYQLIRRKLLPDGFVSFNMETKRLIEFKDLAPEQVFEKQYQKYMTIFESEHTIAKSIVPYRNFDKDADLDDVIMQSKFNIVLETYASNNNQIVFTEKIIRSLRLPRPWLLYGAQNAVALLREWGFDVLDDFVDHDRYDCLDFDIDRQTVILDMAQEMQNFDTEKHWDRLKTASDHNLELLKYWKKNMPNLLAQDIEKMLDKIYNIYGTR